MVTVSIDRHIQETPTAVIDEQAGAILANKELGCVQDLAIDTDVAIQGWP